MFKCNTAKEIEITDLKPSLAGEILLHSTVAYIKEYHHIESTPRKSRSHSYRFVISTSLNNHETSTRKCLQISVMQRCHAGGRGHAYVFGTGRWRQRGRGAFITRCRTLWTRVHVSAWGHFLCCVCVCVCVCICVCVPDAWFLLRSSVSSWIWSTGKTVCCIDYIDND